MVVSVWLEALGWSRHDVGKEEVSRVMFFRLLDRTVDASQVHAGTEELKKDLKSGRQAFCLWRTLDTEGWTRMSVIFCATSGLRKYCMMPSKPSQVLDDFMKSTCGRAPTPQTRGWRN